LPLKHRAPFDVARYYESIDHEVLLAILRQRGASAASAEVVADYLRLPDRHRSGRGITAGGSLSPLLIPLDEAMNRLWRRYGLFYVRYMDDFVLMAPTRHKLRRGRGVSGRRRRVRRSERQQGRETRVNATNMEMTANWLCPDHDDLWAG